MAPAAIALAAATAAVAGCAEADVRPAARDERRARPPVVLRVGVGDGPRPAEVATAVATGDGRVVTVAHVLEPGLVVRVGGHRARVARVDERLDLAVLAVPGLRAPALRLGDDARGDVAVRVLRDGRARSLPAAVRRMIVAHVTTAAGGAPATRPGLDLAAAVAGGDSGAPVTGRDGAVVGIVFARSLDRAGTAFAVRADAVRALLAGSGQASQAWTPTSRAMRPSRSSATDVQSTRVPSG